MSLSRHVLLLLIAVFVFSAPTLALEPTKQQIEQFKKLPKNQQVMLAEKYGIDLSLLEEDDSDKDADKSKKNERNNSRRASETEEKTDEEKFKPEQEELKPFGYELFSEVVNDFQPSETPIVPSNYKVGVGDKFNISYFGKENLDREIEIDSEGKLPLPNLTPISVIGMTFSEMKDVIRKKVAQKFIGVDAHVSISELKTVRVVVVGEVKYPGSYSLPALSSITHAIFSSGGISQIGSLRDIQLKRGSKVVSNLDLYKLLLAGDSTSDIALQNGDVVFIPPVGKQVSVSGAVRRPAIYELRDNDNLDDLLVMSGGLKPGALLSKGVIERFTGKSFKTVIKADLNNQLVELKAGDEVFIPNSSSEFDNAITLLGAVTHPGHYAWSPEKTISNVISSLRADLLPIADYFYALVLREKSQAGEIEIYQFSPTEAVEKNPLHDLKLEPRDTIIVFSRFEEKALEEKQLSKLALTKEELQLNEKIELWKEYERSKFYEFINLDSMLEKELEKANEKEVVLGSVEAILKGQKKELEDEDYSVFSRKRLLEPLILRLEQQASIYNELKIFDINGEVKHPGIYPLPVNASIGNAVAAAGGLKESAFLKKAEITRLTSDVDAEVSHIQLNLEAELSKGINSTAVKSKDSINIMPKPNWHQNIKVNLIGEVKFPGVYTIKRGETLAEVIERAGGVTNFAFTEGAIFTRESIRENEQKQIKDLSERLRRDIASSSFQSSITSSKLSYADMDKLLNDLADIDALGRLVIDLEKVLAKKQQIELRNNDTLYVPTQQHTVSVIGEVNVATAHLFNANLTLDDYLRISGGLKQRADSERIYIIKANGSVEVPNRGSWFAVSNSTEIEAGDTIVVPLDSEYMDQLTLWSTATQIVYQIGVAAAAIGSL
ncbi:polysaccharide biosynthesis protein [Pseudoalteromonas sp. BMB]|uniref:SLBB domain-containing protein n=1 Tax=Pseudoalteromonas sp. BMB TaxID=1874619 RepID=UPI00083D6C1D|nr:SLBB domain-containing protein [Pseudoalteromonas sp. BMB]ODB36776.1 polysaccharide biosynthesis protein [Pseudoalteromonas sp. BMB]